LSLAEKNLPLIVGIDLFGIKRKKAVTLGTASSVPRKTPRFVYLDVGYFGR
jgi:hypothetical protein